MPAVNKNQKTDGKYGKNTRVNSEIGERFLKRKNEITNSKI